MKDNPTIVGSVHKDRIHESAIKHVTGQADYSDDIALPEGALHAYLGGPKVAHATIRSMDFSAVLTAPGVIGVLTAEDVPGVNDISPTGLNDEPVFPKDKIQFMANQFCSSCRNTRFSPPCG